MVQILDAPDNVVAFRAIGEVTKDEYTNIIEPAVEKLVRNRDEIIFLLLIDTEIENFTSAAWMQDALIGLKNLGKWKRLALVTDSKKAISFTNKYSYMAPGEFRGYKKETFNEALNWVQGNEIEN